MHKFRAYTKSWIKQESKQKKALRAKKILKKLTLAYPKAKIALKYGSDIQLLVAVILSAQCTDKKVNEVTKALFQKYKKVSDFAKANLKTFENEIKQTGFYHTKARNIIAAAIAIQKKHKGKLPQTMEEMVMLPGIGRKSANIILGNVYGVVEGVAVDTHVGRISQRLGFSVSDNPVKIEKDLMELFPKKEWFPLTYKIIDHGRAVCTAQRRRCDICPLRDICPSSLV